MPLIIWAAFAEADVGGGVDSLAKRSSAIGITLHSLRTLPSSDAVIGLADRRHLATAYTFGVGQTISVAQVFEADTPQTVTPKRTYVIVQVTETDLAQTTTAPIIVPIEQVTEIDLATIVSWAPKKRLVAQVIEVDTANSVSRRQASAFPVFFF